MCPTRASPIHCRRARSSATAGNGAPRALRRRVLAPPLTVAHMVLLGALRDDRVATADDLAERLALDVARVLALLDELVVGGFVRPARAQ